VCGHAVTSFAMRFGGGGVEGSMGSGSSKLNGHEALFFEGLSKENILVKMFALGCFLFIFS